jgi:cobalt-zinc-cadmium efflux system membrane fusion protein
MKRIINILIPTILLVACSQSEEVEVKKENDAEVAVIDEKQESLQEVEVIECTGDISVPGEAIISIHSPIKGVLKTIKVLEGEKVSKGQVLGTLEHIEIIKIQEEYLKSKVQHAFWKSEFDRKTTLFKQEVIPLKEFQEVEASYLSEKAVFESLRKQIQFLGISETKLNQGTISKSITITSPINGFVTSVHGNTGMFADQDTKIFELVDDTHKHVHLNVFATDISKVSVGQTILFRIAGSEKEYQAKVHLIGKSVDAISKAIHVHGHLENEKADLIIGTTVFGRILVE